MVKEINLLKRNDISFNNISLKLYKDFFKNILCNRVFLYILEDNRKIKLLFEETHFLHILGAHHILGGNYKASKFNEEIELGNMTFEELEKRNNVKFNDFTDRFLNFANFYYTITNCSMIYFDKDVYNNTKNGEKESKMDFKYILYNDLNNKIIHAGLDTYNKGRSFYCKSLIITSIQNKKIINNQIPINIKTIIVEDKKTKKQIFKNDLIINSVNSMNIFTRGIGQAK